MADTEGRAYPKRSQAGPAGVVLVLDSSGSVGEYDWKVTLQFATQVTMGLRNRAKENLSNAVTWIKQEDTKHDNLKEYLSEPGSSEVVHIGAVVYSTFATTHWDLNERKSTGQLAEDICNLRYEGGKTNTYEALVHAENIFMESNTVYSKHIVVLITDGQSNNKKHTVAQAERMHAHGVEIFVIGVGQVSRDEMELVGSKPVSEHCHFVPKHSALQATTDKIVKVTYKAVEKEIQKSSGSELLKKEVFQILFLLLLLFILRLINSWFFEETEQDL